MEAAFDRFTAAVSRWMARPGAFVVTLALILLWMVSGPFFNYSDGWQLIANTTTTLATTLMVFIVQSTQSRDNAAVQAKLDGLIRVSEASNSLIAVEQRTAAEIAAEAKALREEVENLPAALG